MVAALVSLLPLRDRRSEIDGEAWRSGALGGMEIWLRTCGLPPLVKLDSGSVSGGGMEELRSGAIATARRWVVVAVPVF